MFFRSLVIAVAVAGCASHGVTATTTAGSGVLTYDQFWPQFVTAICNNDATCGAPWFSSQAMCGKAYEGAGPGSAAIAARIAAGTLDFDGAEAWACVADVDCDHVSGGGLPSACAAFISGHVADGGPCQDALECVPGLFCDLRPHCPATCKKILALGAVCSRDAECGQAGCAGGKCAARHSGKSGDVCSQGTCGKGLICKLDVATGKHVCAAPGKLGDACFQGDPVNSCVYGTRCTFQLDDTPTVCEALVKAGEACDQNGAGTSECQFIDQVCIGEPGMRTCRSMKLRGEACVPAASSAGEQCAQATVCDEKTNTCGDLPGAGKPCAAGGQCAQGNFCGEDQTCTAKVGVGGACPTYQECADGLICGAGKKCAAKVAEGGACKIFAECAAGLICGADKKCAAKVAAGGPCVNGSACASGLTCGAEHKCTPVPCGP